MDLLHANTTQIFPSMFIMLGCLFILSFLLKPSKWARKKRKLRIFPPRFARLSANMAVLTRSLLKKWNRKFVLCFHNSFKVAITSSFLISLEKLSSRLAKQGIILIKMKVKLLWEMLAEQMVLIQIGITISHRKDKLFWRKEKKKLHRIKHSHLTLLSVSSMDNKLTMYLLI